MVLLDFLPSAAMKRCLLLLLAGVLTACYHTYNESAESRALRLSVLIRAAAIWMVGQCHYFM